MNQPDDKHGALIELAATWCEAQGRVKDDPMARVWARRAEMLREGYKPALVSASSATVAPDEIARLREIEHMIWHLLDDSEESADGSRITLFPGEDYTKLCSLLPEDHPAAVTETDAPCHTCDDDPKVCAEVPGLRHCEKAQRAEERRSGADKMLAFAAEVINEHRAELGDIDGGWMQDRLEALGILTYVTVNEPCGEDCRCVEYANTFPTRCLRLADDVEAVMPKTDGTHGEGERK